MMNKLLSVFVTCPKGLEYVLEKELDELLQKEAKVRPAGIAFEATLPEIYRFILWSRTANRVLLALAESEVHTAEQLYDLVYSVDWQEHMAVDNTLVVDFSGESKNINNTAFGAVKVKDAIVDQFRDRVGDRPNVTRDLPDIRINVKLAKGRAVVALDLSGESLHRRGYRIEAGKAPIKENLGAALLQRCNWSALGQDGASLLDPMCGSGTLLVEGAMILCDKAPALDRAQFGFLKWKQHQDGVWKALIDEAIERFELGLEKCIQQQAAGRSLLLGYDADSSVVYVARNNIKRAGLEAVINVAVQSLAELKAPSVEVELGDAETGDVKPKGLLLTNPPYGERLGDVESLKGLYRCLGDKLKSDFEGWKAAIFTGNVDLGRRVGLRSYKQYKLFNGSLPSQLIMIDVRPENYVKTDDSKESQVLLSRRHIRVANPERAAMFGNRLKKNLRTLGKWAKKNKLACYRIYDADMPEFSLAVDIYGDWVHVQEYAAPASIDEKAAKDRLDEALSVLPDVLGVSPEQVVIKQRRRQKGDSQYEKHDQKAQRMVVDEFGCKFYVNLIDYIDTGLFLDHRPVRKWIQAHSAGKRFLNLFCYTGAATIHAVKGGAAETVSVDMSNTYLDWGKENLALNGFSERGHDFVQADCLRWLDTARDKFDMIFLDPPTFSNSKRMEGVLDVQRDHVDMINKAMALLTKGGVLVFSTNLRRFKLDVDALSAFELVDVSKSTIDKDFERNSRIHQCWHVKYKTLTLG
ncbi:bifunctional 23S rRNA (guanine(2069)-N(7))-methyltransferase RlmK/23S rRNA (guanine(2445)-N(2))-methyltransferase RlmL [Alkalimarinus alittae]|uniref:Ribosomal RNA large subunit methyltransferase K/L n=1 Tax=Alkalimarinus alittae TaxID=2961619 RepID=A0ABY6MYF3_9ALTE|nr:bifunctional 23S rRNA (guanine(2069)-N(7))-methyltransferase RlmK/23S rRNA (guanine(2445)-N(2))-methyltransferase RlmL [Alkalimarinus alittae]UZE94865.1 bifunctional 23S rRNA (guanine(2069)-N(7))-methyltransferase RlmK/23S rRNA (guanine(2445)-N(2))-methyltransferase RlmL [Alkalimarinus alittae]